MLKLCIKGASALNGTIVYRNAKRAFDVCFSCGMIVALSPLMLIVATAIRLETPGPIIFRQRRVGQNGTIFEIYKFRSMKENAEEMLDELATLNEKDGPVFKIRDDPRITHVGSFLRKTSLDELPQFWNVLKGDMSVVGPRPPLPKEVELYTSHQMKRLSVKPGLTCYWQVQVNRDEIPFDEWVEMDLRYIREASLLTDLKLIISTVRVMVTGQGR